MVDHELSMFFVHDPMNYPSLLQFQELRKIMAAYHGTLNSPSQCEKSFGWSFVSHSYPIQMMVNCDII